MWQPSFVNEGISFPTLNVAISIIEKVQAYREPGTFP